MESTVRFQAERRIPLLVIQRTKIYLQVPGSWNDTETPSFSAGNKGTCCFSELEACFLPTALRSVLTVTTPGADSVSLTPSGHTYCFFHLSHPVSKPFAATQCLALEAILPFSLQSSIICSAVCEAFVASLCLSCTL